MNGQQKEIAEQAYQEITAVISKLMQPLMNTVQGIGEARQGVVVAQNANHLLDR